MARPYREHDGAARQRIIDAFWMLLEEKGYPSITVVGLSRAANVSPNTLYYHFSGLEDIAHQSFGETLLAELPHAIFFGTKETLQSMLEASSMGMQERFRHLRLFASSGSAVLTGIAANSLKAVWLSSLGVEETDLSQEEQNSMCFIVGGVVAMLGAAKSDDLGYLGSVFERPLGQGISEEMRCIKARHL